MTKVFTFFLLFVALSSCDTNIKPKRQSETSSQSDFLCLKSQNTCEFLTEYGSFKILFSQEGEGEKIRTEEPFQIKIMLQNQMQQAELLHVSSHLEGKNMYMGKIPLFFDKANINSLVGEGLLGSCSEEFMIWRLWIDAELKVKDQVKKQVFSIEFGTKRL